MTYYDDTEDFEEIDRDSEERVSGGRALGAVQQCPFCGEWFSAKEIRGHVRRCGIIS